MAVVPSELCFICLRPIFGMADVVPLKLRLRASAKEALYEGRLSNVRTVQQTELANVGLHFRITSKRADGPFCYRHMCAKLAKRMAMGGITTRRQLRTYRRSPQMFWFVAAMVRCS